MDPRTGLPLTGTAPVPNGILGGIGTSSAPIMLPRRPYCTWGMGAGSNRASVRPGLVEAGGSAEQAVTTKISRTRQKRQGGRVNMLVRLQHRSDPPQTQLCLDLTIRTDPHAPFNSLRTVYAAWPVVNLIGYARVSTTHQSLDLRHGAPCLAAARKPARTAPATSPGWCCLV